MDIKTIQQAINQDNAFTKLYNHYFDRVYNYLRARVNCQSDAEDLTSEVWHKVYKRLRQFKGKTVNEFSGWLFTLARNHLFDFYRTKKDEYIIKNEGFDYCSNEIQTTLMVKEDLESLFMLIKSLSQKQQEIFTLKFMADLPNKEIANLLKIHEKTVSATLSRIIQQTKASWPQIANHQYQ